MSDIKQALEEYIDSTETLLVKIEEFKKKPNPILLDYKDVLWGVGKLMRAAGLLVKLTPYGWLSWILTGGGMFFEAIGKGRG